MKNQFKKLGVFIVQCLIYSKLLPKVLGLGKNSYTKSQNWLVGRGEMQGETQEEKG